MLRSINISVSTSHSHHNHSFYGACLEFICATWDSCPYQFNIPITLALAYAIIGIVNSAMAVIVFSQDKYNHRITSKLLKYCSYFNFLAVVFLFAKFVVYYALVDASGTNTDPTRRRNRRAGSGTDFIQRGFGFSYLAALNMSQGTVAYLCILRFVNSYYPLFIGFSPHVHTLTYIVLLFLCVVSLGIHTRAFFSKNGVVGLMDADDLHLNVAYQFLTIAIVISFNIAWVFRERMRQRQMSMEHCSSSTKTSRKIFKYAAVSSLLFTFTTLPATLYFVVPKPSYVELTCETCLKQAETGDYLTMLMFSLCFFDNLLYFAQSKQYREDLKTCAQKNFFLGRWNDRLICTHDSKNSSNVRKSSLSRVTLVGACNTNREAKGLTLTASSEEKDSPPVVDSETV